MGLAIYLLFCVSWFLHLPARFPILGVIRFDLVLIVVLLALSVFAGRRRGDVNAGDPEADFPTIRILWVLIAYILLTFPLVQWPGSVIRTGFPNFLKAVVFFLFTWRFVRTERQLKIFLAVFLFCQVFRVLEPLYLHLTEEYWGSRASLRGWASMDRLSGAPSDVINPNGLAFLCLSVLPFLYYYLPLSKINRVLLPLLFPPILYAMMLTGSRSGVVALAVLMLVLAIRSRQKVLVSIFIGIAVVIGFQQLGVELRDRYVSLFDDTALNASTVQGRIDGLKQDLEVAMRRPLFGHGLGTSLEANFNFMGRTHLAHNVIAEISQELGFLGLAICLAYVLSIYRKVRDIGRMPASDHSFVDQTGKALVAWFYMNLVFSMASFGLSGYQWYLFPALILKVHAFRSARVPQEECAPIGIEPDAEPSGLRP